MRILMLGSGVIGVTNAWYLRQAGHEVTVLDREAGPALETSFANAGQLSFGYTSPWAAPGVPLKAIKWLFEAHAPLSIRPTANPDQYRWLWQMLRNCSAARYAVNKARMVRLSDYSRDCINELSQATGIDYEGRQLGTTQLFRTRQQLDAAAQDIEVLREYGVPYEVLDQAGVEFRYGQEVGGLQRDGDRIAGVRIGDRLESADAYVVALGSWSPQLLKPLGLRLPVYPLKGYSLTVPITDPDGAPTSTILDESY